MTHHIIVTGIQGTTLGMGHATSRGIRTTTWATSNFTAQQRIAIVTIQTGVTAKACGGVQTIETLSGQGITLSSMSIALTDPTLWEIPIARLTLITLPAVGVGMAGTLSS